MAASSEMLGLVTLTELLNEEGDFIQKHIAKFVVTACALQIYKVQTKINYFSRSFAYLLFFSPPPAAILTLD